jgi:hypothetical protein
MTVDIKLEAIANAIANLDLGRIDNKRFDQIPENAEMLTPVFFPRPDQFIRGIEITTDALGAGTNRLATLRYTLTYTYLHAQLGTGIGGLFATYPGMIKALAVIMNTMIANDYISKALDLELVDLAPGGFVAQDPAGKDYHGFDVSLKIMEFIN